MFSDRWSGRIAAPAGALVLAVAVVLGGCGGNDDDDPADSPRSAKTETAPAKEQPRGTADRGARRCTRSAFLAALLVDVDPLPFKVERVKCEGGFGRSRFVARGCVPGQATKVPCGSAKVAAWRLGAKRWRLITYADKLSCADVRREASKFPQALCD